MILFIDTQKHAHNRIESIVYYLYTIERLFIVNIMSGNKVRNENLKCLQRLLPRWRPPYHRSFCFYFIYYFSVYYQIHEILHTLWHLLQFLLDIFKLARTDLHLAITPLQFNINKIEIIVNLEHLCSFVVSLLTFFG